MFIKYLTIIFLIFVVNACTYYDCTVDDNTPCGTQCEQAKRFVEKLIEHPSAWECIMENEKCIDCTAFLERVRKDKSDIKYYTKTIQKFSDFECKIMYFCHIQVSGKFYYPELQGKTVLSVQLDDCYQPEFDPSESPDIIKFGVNFFINMNKKLELLSISFGG
jgi:hypothetical protein